MLGTKLRVLYLPGKHTITKLNPKLLFCFHYQFSIREAEDDLKVMDIFCLSCCPFS